MIRLAVCWLHTELIFDTSDYGKLLQQSIMDIKRAYEFYYYHFPHNVLTKGESITLHVFLVGMFLLITSSLGAAGRFVAHKIYELIVAQLVQLVT